MSKKKSIWARIRIMKHIVSLWELKSFLTRILPATLVFQRGDRLCLLQMGLFSWVEKIPVDLQRKPSMQEAAAHAALFPCESWLSVSKEYFLQIIISRWRMVHFVPNKPTQLRWRNTGISQKLTICVSWRSIEYIVPCEIWVSLERKSSSNRLLKVVVCLFAQNTPIHLGWRNTGISPKKSIYLRSCTY
jgi:hypothetical protein